MGLAQLGQGRVQVLRQAPQLMASQVGPAQVSVHHGRRRRVVGGMPHRVAQIGDSSVQVLRPAEHLVERAQLMAAQAPVDHAVGVRTGFEGQHLGLGQDRDRPIHGVRIPPVRGIVRERRRQGCVQFPGSGTDRVLLLHQRGQHRIGIQIAHQEEQPHSGTCRLLVCALGNLQTQIPVEPGQYGGCLQVQSRCLGQQFARGGHCRRICHRVARALLVPDDAAPQCGEPIQFPHSVPPCPGTSLRR